MKTTKVNSQLKFIIVGLAIATSAICQPANAQSSRSRVPEIGWDSKVSSLGIDKPKNIGKTYDFYCQAAEEDLIHAPLWGTNVYTANSGICSSAVHSGIISTEGGTVTIELLEGQEFYTGSNKNEIKSKDRQGTSLSYGFLGETHTNNGNDSNNGQPQQPSVVERVMVNSVQRGVERSIEKVITDIFK